MKKFLLVLLLLSLCCCTVPCFAESPVQVTAEVEKWDWTPRTNTAGVLLFTLENKSGQTLDGLTLTLSPAMDDGRAWGDIVFTKVGEKKIGVRKRSDTTELETLAAGEKTIATVEWSSPKSMAAMKGAQITLTVADADGNVLGSGNVSMKKTSEMLTPQDLPLGGMRMSQWMIIALGLAAILLLAAFSRNWFRKQSETERR